jgi:hypothetical protein
MHVRFEFQGGFLDGRVVSTGAADPDEAKRAEAYWLLTDWATVGKRIKPVLDLALIQSGTLPERGLAGFVYEVVGRRMDRGQAIVRVQFVGTDH